METLRFSIHIARDRQAVWNIMLDDPTYRVWAKEFGAACYYAGSWQAGSEIRFLAPGDDGSIAGMYSRVKENRAPEFISIEHLGLINQGHVDTESAEAKKWAPAYENYTFTSHGEQTELIVEVQVADGYRSLFEEMWPRALGALKSLCEKS